MSEITNTDEAMTEDEILAYTQSKRRALVDAITEDGMPIDKDERKVLLTALKDMDQSALANKRIGVEDKMADNDARAADIANKLISRLSNKDPFARGGGGVVVDMDTEFDKIPALDANPGEDEIGISTETHAEFIRKFED